MFLSPHKLVGGPGSPGVLVVKKRLIKNAVPTQPGGGTVALVTPESVSYWDSEEHREEGGTPAIIESIRAGLAFQLKTAVGTDTIAGMERGFIQRAIAAWQQNPSLRLIGNLGARAAVDRVVHGALPAPLPAQQLRRHAAERSVRHPGARRLLVRGAVHAPAARRRPRAVARVHCVVDDGFLSLKPGWARVNFNYFISNAEFRYIVAAVNLVGQFGHVLLPEYELDLASGQWQHVRGSRTCRCSSAICATARASSNSVAPRAPARERARRISSRRRGASSSARRRRRRAARAGVVSREGATSACAGSRCRRRSRTTCARRAPR